jgi:D-glycero-alpha-D-manno-heptose-7-phosphate kinase
MHELKNQAYIMKECILKADFEGFARCLQSGWESKKKTSDIITNPEIEKIYQLVMQMAERRLRFQAREEEVS